MASPRPAFGSDDEFTFRGLRYLISMANRTRRTGPDGVVLVKPREWIDFYCDLIERERIRKVLELGVWQGGMSVFLPSFEQELRYMGVDMAPAVEPLLSMIADMPEIRDRVRILFETGQSDPSLPGRISDYFGSPELDLVIDDASHMYDPSRRSFEYFFPMLRPGAPYIVEDWAWAHWPGYRPRSGLARQPSLANLLFEVSILAASAPDIVASVEVRSAMFVVRRGTAELKPGWRLNDSLHFNRQSDRLPMLRPSRPTQVMLMLGLLKS